MGYSVAKQSPMRPEMLGKIVLLVLYGRQNEAECDNSKGLFPWLLLFPVWQTADAV
jgi:hypothetical protein